jgi:hypothetical protein
MGEMRNTSTILVSALDGGEWSISHPDHFTPGEGAPILSDREGPRMDLAVVKKINVIASAGN